MHLPEHQIALITSDYAPSRTPSACWRKRTPPFFDLPMPFHCLPLPSLDLSLPLLDLPLPPLDLPLLLHCLSLSFPRDSTALCRYGVLIMVFSNICSNVPTVMLLSHALRQVIMECSSTRWP